MFTESVNHPTYLKNKATGNHALDAYAYGPWPHLFTRLACTYKPPAEMLLTLLYLWDRTVGTGNDCGDCALSQIPVHHRHRNKWLAAFIAAGFFECVKTKPGGKSKKQEGSFYVYKNPSANQWDAFFRAASVVVHYKGWDTAPT